LEAVTKDGSGGGRAKTHDGVSRAYQYGMYGKKGLKILEKHIAKVHELVTSSIARLVRQTKGNKGKDKLK